jgi:hypothetical protein
MMMMMGAMRDVDDGNPIPGHVVIKLLGQLVLVVLLVQVTRVGRIVQMGRVERVTGG